MITMNGVCIRQEGGIRWEYLSLNGTVFLIIVSGICLFLNRVLGFNLRKSVDSGRVVWS